MSEKGVISVGRIVCLGKKKKKKVENNLRVHQHVAGYMTLLSIV